MSKSNSKKVPRMSVRQVNREQEIIIKATLCGLIKSQNAKSDVSMNMNLNHKHKVQ